MIFGSQSFCLSYYRTFDITLLVRFEVLLVHSLLPLLMYGLSFSVDFVVEIDTVAFVVDIEAGSLELLQSFSVLLDFPNLLNCKLILTLVSRYVIDCDVF